MASRIVRAWVFVFWPPHSDRDLVTLARRRNTDFHGRARLLCEPPYGRPSASNPPRGTRL